MSHMTDADRIPAMSAAGGWAEARRLAGELTKLRAERDALLPVREAAKAWRESLNLVEQIDVSDEEHALADALGMPIRVTFPLTEPTEGAQP